METAWRRSRGASGDCADSSVSWSWCGTIRLVELELPADEGLRHQRQISLRLAETPSNKLVVSIQTDAGAVLQELGRLR